MTEDHRRGKDKRPKVFDNVIDHKLEKGIKRRNEKRKSPIIWMAAQPVRHRQQWKGRMQRHTKTDIA